VQDFDTDYKPKQPVLFNKRQYYLLSEAYHLISEAEKSSPSGISTDESLSLADKLTDIFTDLGIR